MPIDLDSLQELASLGLLAERPAAATLLAELQSAAAEKTALLAKRQAAADAAERARTPIAFTLSATPEGPDDLAIVQVTHRPILSCVTIDGQLYEPRLARGPICFLPARFAAALNRQVSPSGWSWCTVAQIVALDEWFSPQDFRTIVSASTSEQIPILLANWRRVSGRSGTLATGFATTLNSKLSQLSHQTSGPVQGTARGEHDAEERDADRILSLAGASANASADIDRDTEQRRLTGNQINASNDKFSMKANRDAARAAYSERVENAKFEAAIQAELLEHEAGKAAATGAQ